MRSNENLRWRGVELGVGVKWEGEEYHGQHWLWNKDISDILSRKKRHEFRYNGKRPNVSGLKLKWEELVKWRVAFLGCRRVENNFWNLTFFFFFLAYMRNAFSLFFFFLGSWHTIRAGGKKWSLAVPLRVRRAPGAEQQWCQLGWGWARTMLSCGRSIALHRPPRGHPAWVQFGGSSGHSSTRFCPILRLRALSLSRFLQNIQTAWQKIWNCNEIKEWLWQGWLVPQRRYQISTLIKTGEIKSSSPGGIREIPACIRRRANFNSASFLAFVLS